MLKLTPDEMIRKIEDQEIFEAVAEDYSFTLKVEKYVHYICAAVHDGHQFRPSLWDNCLHSSYERWYEEDPCTLEMVRDQPIVIAGRDSRFEYDLNRDPGNAIYEDAWGKELWKSPLSESERAMSLEKHSSFYRVVHALISKLEQMFPRCVAYDIHSYNWKRWSRAVPTWNLGTDNVDNERFGSEIESWRDVLSRIDLPHGIPTTSEINNTFFGNGYFLKYITENFENTLVLATEVAKIYCDETTYVIFPEVVSAIRKGLDKHLSDHAASFGLNNNG